MRVIAGTARGLRLVAPKGNEVRPTLDRVRESLFNILAPYIEGAHFIDLFAGTGAIGIEALSRGAASCAFVENDRQALDIIARNLQTTRVADRAHICRATLPGHWGDIPGRPGGYDIIFADPPYAFTDHHILFEGLARYLKLGNEGIFVIEHASRSQLVFPQELITSYRCARYGEAALSFCHLTHPVVSDRL